MSDDFVVPEELGAEEFSELGALSLRAAAPLDTVAATYALHARTAHTAAAEASDDEAAEGELTHHRNVHQAGLAGAHRRDV